MTELPSNANLVRPLYRVLIRQHWSVGAWQVLPQAPRWGVQRFQPYVGTEVIKWQKRTVPVISQASFRLRFGHVNGMDYDAGIDTDWSGWYVRIQAAPPPTLSEQQHLEEFVPAWATVWMGTIEHRETMLAPGASYLRGYHVFHCLDLIGITRRWQLKHHGAVLDGTARVCRGHPGYNERRSDGSLSGNRSATTKAFTADTTGSYLDAAYCHTQEGVGSLWSDAQVVDHAIVSGRSEGDPLFLSQNTTGLLSGTEPWPVRPDDTTWDVLTRVLRRQRGRGLAYLKWISDPTTLTGNPILALAVNSQHYDDVSWTDPTTGSTVTVDGADTDGTAVASVDLVGDHRNRAPTFELGDRFQHRVLYLESEGEPIEVVASLAILDETLENRWAAATETAFIALAADARKGQAYESVFQLYSLPSDWNGAAADGNGGTAAQIDFRCDDAGAIAPGSATVPDTGPLTCRILRDIPTLIATDDLVPKIRSDPLILIRTGDDGYLDGRTMLQMTMRVRDDGILVTHSGDDVTGNRFVSVRSDASLGAGFNSSDLVVTVAIRLPHCLRMASGDSTSPRRKTIRRHGLHLWLVDKQARTSLELATAQSGGYLGRYDEFGTDPGGGATYRIVRDDRAYLARDHALAWAWYGSNRRTASWQLRCDLGVPSFTQSDGTVTDFPTFGSVVHELIAGGETFTLDTPLTDVDVDVENYLTTFSTDWCDLDLR